MHRMPRSLMAPSLAHLVASVRGLWETSQPMSRKHTPKAPRRLRMNRAQRLQSAGVWLLAQAGREPAQIGASYRRWYGVDWFCVSFCELPFSELINPLSEEDYERRPA